MTTVRRHVSHHSITTSPLLPLGVPFLNFLFSTFFDTGEGRLTLDQKNYDGDVQELCLDFTVTEESFGKRHVVELKSGGKDISVTNENKMQYIHAMADYKLNQQLLSGGNYDTDIDDLKNNTRYTGGYNEGSRTIKIFWEVIKGFEPKERCMLLKFVTSCSRAPLLGFKYLQPAFTIHKVEEKVRKWKVISIPKFSPSYSPSPTH